MNITYCKDYDQLSLLGSQMVRDEIFKKSDLLLCAATGNSPTGLYKHLSQQFLKVKNSSKKLRVIKLDEWGGIKLDSKISCETYLKENLLNPLAISSDRYLSFNSNPESPSKECERIQAKLEQIGPVDICILGLGTNGHIGLNEPSSFLAWNCHVAELSVQSMRHPMIQSASEKPTYGLTLGMKNILDSKKIILLVTGRNKQKVIDEFLTQKITTQLPASFLWLHQQVECIMDQSCYRSS